MNKLKKLTRNRNIKRTRNLKGGYNSQKRKLSIRSKNSKKKLRKKRNMKGGVYGGWAPWEGVHSSPFSHIGYNRFQRAPFLSEMGDVNTIY